MNQNNTITIDRHERVALAWLIAVLFASAIQMLAHGGFDHVIGTVVKMQDSVLTVKTSTGNVEVRLTPKTEITKGDEKANVADLKPGTRVVVDIPQGNEAKIAHSIKVGVSTPVDGHAHQGHQ